MESRGALAQEETRVSGAARREAANKKKQGRSKETPTALTSSEAAEEAGQWSGLPAQALPTGQVRVARDGTGRDRGSNGGAIESDYNYYGCNNPVVAPR